MPPRHSKQRRGHYCWACDRRRANEKFSGRGHARHLCKDCARLGKEELAYRQAVRNLERLLSWDGRIPKRNREQVQKYLRHKDERVRAYALRVETADACAAAEDRCNTDLDDLLVELAAEGVVPLEMEASQHLEYEDDEEIPF